MAVWNLTLSCGCEYMASEAPDLRQPLICYTKDHGLVSIVAARADQ